MPKVVKTQKLIIQALFSHLRHGNPSKWHLSTLSGALFLPVSVLPHHHQLWLGRLRLVFPPG